MKKTLCAYYQLPVAVEGHKVPIKNSKGDGGKLSMGDCCRNSQKSIKGKTLDGLTHAGLI